LAHHNRNLIRLGGVIDVNLQAYGFGLEFAFEIDFTQYIFNSQHAMR
jgi:hypothetical protein